MEEENDPVEEKDEILDDLDFLRKRDVKSDTPDKQESISSSESSTVNQTKVAKRSSGIVLPDSAGSSHQTTNQTIPQVEPSTPEPELTPEPVQEKVTTVKASCPACEQMFAVDMPNSIDEALVACPKCEQRIRLQL